MIFVVRQSISKVYKDEMNLDMNHLVLHLSTRSGDKWFHLTK